MLEIKDVSLSTTGFNNIFGTVTVSGGDLSYDAHNIIGSGMNHLGGVKILPNSKQTNTVLFAFSHQEDFSISDVEDDDNQTPKETSNKAPTPSP
ncbi:MAG: hypothetical protein ACR2HS_04950 [Gammaproteobacteria bacterium]